MQFELYREPSGTYYYRLMEGFSKFILIKECYLKKESALRDIAIAKKNLITLSGIEINKTVRDEYYFEIKSNEGRIVANSCLFKTAQALRDELNSIKTKINDAPIVEKFY